MSPRPRPVAVQPNERVVCAVLSAQAADLRDRIDTGATIDLLLRTTDLLSSLSTLVFTLSHRAGAADPQLTKQCSDSVAAATEINQVVDNLAFVHAQRQDFARQLADCLVTALDRLAKTGTRLSPDELAALYVSEDQRQIHAAVTKQLEMGERRGASATSDCAEEGQK